MPFHGTQMMAGLLGPATSWRVPYILVAAPSLALALVMVLTTREPPRRVGRELGSKCARVHTRLLRLP